jgi:NTE family protein
MPDPAPGAAPRIGLALGGGSARGWAHIGVIQALAEAGITPTIVCGTSIGALVGAAFVADRLAALQSFAVGLTRREMVRFLDVQLSGGGIVDGKRIVAMLRTLGIDGPIEGYARTYAAVATDLETGREIWFRDGPILDAVRASISLPGIFSPVRMDGRWLADGGLVNPVPVSQCRALGADVVIAVNLSSDIVARFDVDSAPANAGPISSVGERGRWFVDQIPAAIRQQAATIMPRLLRSRAGTPSYFEVLTNAINVMEDRITRARLAGEPPHVLLEPKLRRIRPLDFHRAAEAIAEGRACVEQALPALRRYVPGSA